jgi:hypothetical protein
MVSSWTAISSINFGCVWVPEVLEDLKVRFAYFAVLFLVAFADGALMGAHGSWFGIRVRRVCRSYPQRLGLVVGFW